MYTDNPYLSTFTNALKQTKEKESQSNSVKKNKRPLKMPKDYDFGVRGVDWNQYKNDYVLRTDAVWEKSKLMEIFYTHYKSRLIYNPVENKYTLTELRQNPTPVDDLSALEDQVPFHGYNDVDGCIWQFANGPVLQKPHSISKFVSDKEGDSWYLCHLAFQRFMMCQERSPVKIDEAHLNNGGFFDYPCYD